MGQRGISHHLTSLMTSNPSGTVGLALVAVLAQQLGLATPALAQVSLPASRTQLLYAQSADVDCTALHKITDDGQLPFYVARLHVEGIPSGLPVRYRWSVAKKAAGLLAADLDLGPMAVTSDVIGMCSAFGNMCVLTQDRLKFYNEPTVFFVAPTCDILPNDTEKPFRGGTTKIRVNVTAGRRRVGRATITIGWGREGTVVVFAEDNQGRFDDGIGKPNGVNVPAVTILGAIVNAHPSPEPSGGVQKFKFDGTGFNTVETIGCPLTRFEACVEEDLFSAGRFFPSVAAFYTDGSALCDKMETHTGTCAASPKLEVIPRPRRETYDPDNPAKSTVDLTVRLKNESHAEGGLPPCDFLLRGAGILTCAEDLRVGGVKDSKSMQFDFKHCSTASDQGCLRDSDCDPNFCPTCVAGEVCLTQSHCSQNVSKLCQSNVDCEKTGNPAPCPDCKEGETCIRVLDIPEGFEVGIPVGRSFDLLHETVKLGNDLPDTAKITDTWTANVFIPKVSATAKVKYRIRGRPKPSTTGR